MVSQISGLVRQNTLQSPEVPYFSSEVPASPTRNTLPVLPYEVLSLIFSFQPSPQQYACLSKKVRDDVIPEAIKLQIIRLQKSAQAKKALTLVGITQIFQTAISEIHISYEKILLDTADQITKFIRQFPTKELPMETSKALCASPAKLATRINQLYLNRIIDILNLLTNQIPEASQLARSLKGNSNTSEALDSAFDWAKTVRTTYERGLISGVYCRVINGCCLRENCTLGNAPKEWVPQKFIEALSSRPISDLGYLNISPFTPG